MASMNDFENSDTEDFDNPSEQRAILESIFSSMILHQIPTVNDTDHRLAELLQQEEIETACASDRLLAAEINNNLNDDVKNTRVVRVRTIMKPQPGPVDEIVQQFIVASEFPSRSNQATLESTNRDFDSNDYEELIRLDENVGKNRIDADKLELLPVERFERAKDQSSEETTCSICMEAFSFGEMLRRLSCFHLYHKKCIDTWLKETNACPTCRLPAIE